MNNCNILPTAENLSSGNGIQGKEASYNETNQNPDFQIEGEILISYKGTERHLIVPEGIEVIGQAAFFKNALLKDVTLPSSLRTIEAKAFSGCKNLQSLSIKNQVTHIGDFAFADCSNLKVIDIPSALTHIGRYAFSYVFGSASTKTSQKNPPLHIELPKHLKILGEGSFLGCDGISIYDTLLRQAENAREACRKTSNTITKSQPGRALYDPDNASGHWTNSDRFKAHLILVKSSQTDETFCAVWMASKQEERKYLNTIMDLWDTDKFFDFQSYDSLFEGMISPADKSLVAFYRLKYPYQLEENHKVTYEDFLKKNAVKAVETVALEHKLELLKLLAEKNMLTSDNIDPIFEKLNNDGHTKCVSWIMTYKNEHHLRNDDYLML